MAVFPPLNMETYLHVQLIYWEWWGFPANGNKMKNKQAAARINLFKLTTLLLSSKDTSFLIFLSFFKNFSP